MKKQPLRMGFDLDGVLLYNPARIMRPLVAFIKNILFHKEELTFYYPQSPFSQWMWKMFHKSSIFVAPGLNDIKKLVKEKKIKAYIVTARYKFLGPELMHWVKYRKLDTIFTGIFYNSKNEQPHLFKERMINRLDLDIFVEDNWDIVNYLSSNKKINCKVFWIYNIFDRGIIYVNKFPFLAKVMTKINTFLK